MTLSPKPVVTMKSEHKHSQRGESDPLRWLRFIGAAAAFLAVLGIAIMVFWYVLRAPRF
jgi:magnesium-transporting ATPase (P-type)